ncbi:peptidoglycan/LPS O-acetylase OafA/YrhL [Bradyrhizobium sp. USDA 3311]
MTEETPRIAALDCARGIAAFVVVMWHYQFFFEAKPLTQIFLPFYTNGQIAVDTFFVISGFVLTHAYGDRIRTAGEFWRYILRRLARLYPLHLASLLAVTVILSGLYLKTGKYEFIYGNNDLRHFLLNLGLLQYAGPQAGYSFNGPSWSISTEFWVNAYFGLLILGYRNRLSAFAIVITLSASALLLVAGRSIRIGGILEPELVRTAGDFFAGALVYRLWCSRSKKLSGRGALFVFAGGAILISSMMCPRSNPLDSYVEMLAALVGSTLLVWGCATSAAAKRIGESAAGKWVGDISYSVYMLHFPTAALFVLLEIRHFETVAILGIYLLVTALASTTSYLALENPSRRWLQSLIPQATPSGVNLEAHAWQDSEGDLFLTDRRNV